MGSKNIGNCRLCSYTPNPLSRHCVFDRMFQIRGMKMVKYNCRVVFWTFRCIIAFCSQLAFLSTSRTMNPSLIRRMVGISGSAFVPSTSSNISLFEVPQLMNHSLWFSMYCPMYAFILKFNQQGLTRHEPKHQFRYNTILNNNPVRNSTDDKRKTFCLSVSLSVCLIGSRRAPGLHSELMWLVLASFRVISVFI